MDSKQELSMPPAHLPDATSPTSAVARREDQGRFGERIRLDRMSVD